MNTFMQEQWSWFEGTHGLRDRTLASLSDADLTFTPGGSNVTLGALFREMGDVEDFYTESLKTLKQDWKHEWKNRHPDPEMATRVAKIQGWYATLDAELKAMVAGFSDEDFKKTVERGGYPMPIDTQLQVYLQAGLIFLGKVSVYLRAMNHPLPDDFVSWVG